MAVRNAWTFLDIQAEFGSFDAYLWRFVEGNPKMNRWRSPTKVSAETKESRALGKDLLRRGFTFVGPTVWHAFMQTGA